MRSFQVMRYGRRPTATNVDLAQSVNQFLSLTSLSKHRISMSSITNKEHRGLQLSKRIQEIFTQRRNTLLSNIDLSFRRSNSQQYDTLELPKSQSNLRNFYIFFFILFLFLFLSILYSFVRMINNLE
ncbi:unnamed protein product [Adineta steineri]|uniref:Uncharacterized protein n=1 Tax=Adineta steineri TaxID=433720 RepID=A0A814IH31_9BILA|nr:unnamed protein product [Adineta steineri]